MRPAVQFLLLASMLAPQFAPAEEKGKIRPLSLLQSTPDTLHPLPLGFSSRSMLPWFGPSEPPAFLIGLHGPYFPDRHLLYRANGNDGSGGFWSLPADFPTYGAGAPNPEVTAGRYLPIPRGDGTFDMVRPADWTYLENTGTAGSPSFREAYTLQFDDPPPEGAAWIGDVDGDGVPDLLVGGVDDWESKRFQVFPGAEWGHPWSGVRNPHLGMLPDSDVLNFRGYDIAGNWLGNAVTRYLWWAKGRIEDGRLVFGESTKVRYGETDYPLQWRSHGSGMYPAFMDLPDGKHIILLSDSDKVLAVPVRGTRGSHLHVGKAVPLLRGGGPLRSTINAAVVGVGDLNGDGQAELVVGSGGNGRLTVLRGNRAGEFEELGNIHHRGGPVSADTLAVPVRIDWDGDGLPDLIIGDASGVLSLRRGTEDPLVYHGYDNFRTVSGYIRHRPSDGNLQGEAEKAWSYIQPEVFDWTGDGKLDIITNDNEAKLFLYAGTDEPTVLEEPVRMTHGGRPLAIAWRTRPAVVAGEYGVAGDKRDVLLFAQWNGDLAFAVPEQPGSTNFSSILPLEFTHGSPINLSGPAGLEGRIKLAVTDWDGDGTWDIIVGVQEALQRFFRLSGKESPTSAAYWLRNTGTNSEPSFELPRLITFNDDAPIAVRNHDFNVFPTDLNGDGRMDIIFGDDEGFIFYLFRDELAWDEDISEEVALRRSLAAARSRAGRYGPGDTVFREKWLTKAEPSQWASDWIPSEPGVLSVSPGKAKLETPRTTKLPRVWRYLGTPIEFSPEKELRLAFVAEFMRTKVRSSEGQTFFTIFELVDSDSGHSLVKVGFDSGQRLQISSRDQSRLLEDIRLSSDTPYVIEIELLIRPGKAEDEISVLLAENWAPGVGKKQSARFQLPIEGVADVFRIQMGRKAGSLEIGPFEMKVGR